jgi:hypothetical protein
MSGYYHVGNMQDIQKVTAFFASLIFMAYPCFARGLAVFSAFLGSISGRP